MGGLTDIKDVSKLSAWHLLIKACLFLESDPNTQQLSSNNAAAALDTDLDVSLSF